MVGTLWVGRGEPEPIPGSTTPAPWRPARHGAGEPSQAGSASQTFTAVIEPDEEEGGFVVTFPAIPNLATQGETLEEARLMAEDRLRGYLKVLRETGRPLPAPSVTAPSAYATIVELQIPAGRAASAEPQALGKLSSRWSGRASHRLSSLWEPGGCLLSRSGAWYLRIRDAQRRRRVSQTYTAVIKQAESWWIGWIEEVPGVNCQERTRAELLETLRITLAEALELSRREAREAAGDGFEEIPIAV
jgi:predicted RNase H-like HicB family nuclease